MNTGVQRSAATPPAARTANTKPVGAEPGNAFGQGKSVPLIAMAHQIPFVATASVAHPADLENKISRAVAIRGARYVHIHSPCPLGWGTESSQTILVARLAVQSGLFPLFEAKDGEIAATTTIGSRVPVEDYLKIQKRFRHLFHPQRNDDALATYQAIADNNIRRFGL
jgi:pyruvate ferredoxin oxidoreductase beta subunit